MRAVTGRIAGLVAAAPANVVTNAMLEDPAGANKAAKLTGVQERRHIALGDAFHLALPAATRVLGALDWDPASIDALVYVTQTPTLAMPADAFRLAKLIHLREDCAIIPVNWSCAGFVLGLWLAMRAIPAGGRALLVVTDAVSRILDPRDRATASLFGDAGSATAIEAEGPPQWFALGQDGAGSLSLSQVPGRTLKMEGVDVFNFSLRVVPALVREIRAEGEPDVYLFHQANKMMLEHLARKCEIPPEKVLSNIERFGNCSCASIPLLIATELDRDLARRPARLGMLGFGAGWAWAGVNFNSPGIEVLDFLEV